MLFLQVDWDCVLVDSLCDVLGLVACLELSFRLLWSPVIPAPFDTHVWQSRVAPCEDCVHPLLSARQLQRVGHGPLWLIQGRQQKNFLTAHSYLFYQCSKRVPCLYMHPCQVKSGARKNVVTACAHQYQLAGGEVFQLLMPTDFSQGVRECHAY